MANPQPTNYGRTGSRHNLRPNHLYGAATIGRRFTAAFRQVLTGELRTIEIIRYFGSDVWKARIKETRGVLTRLGQQVEFASAPAACADVTEYLQRQGMFIEQPWEGVIPAPQERLMEDDYARIA